MRTQSVTQRFEFIRYSLGNITFLVCYFRALESRIEKTYFAVEFRVVLCFFPPKYVFCRRIPCCFS
jgi:hypothetical protein